MYICTFRQYYIHVEYMFVVKVKVEFYILHICVCLRHHSSYKTHPGYHAVSHKQAGFADVRLGWQIPVSSEPALAVPSIASPHIACTMQYGDKRETNETQIKVYPNVSELHINIT